MSKPKLERAPTYGLPAKLHTIASALLLLGFPLFAFAFFDGLSILAPMIINIATILLLGYLTIFEVWHVLESWHISRIQYLADVLRSRHDIRKDAWFASTMPDERRIWGPAIHVILTFDLSL